MSDAGYEILSIDDLERYPDPDDTQILRPLRRRLGFRPFGLNVWLGENEGDRVIERHREPEGTEELYVVLRGTARFAVGDETFDASPGTFVHVPSGTPREAHALEGGTTILAMGAKPGEPFVPTGWEEFFVAFSKLRGGDVTGGRTIVDEVVALHPDEWQGHYNAACFEALAGDGDRALAHLEHAARLDRRAVRDAARDDSDLDSIRDDARYTEALS